jgi:hypothetical protein
MLSRRGLFLFPARSMVRHTGYDSRATNSWNPAGWEDIPSPAPPMDSIIWPQVEERSGSAELWRRAVNVERPTLLYRGWRKLGRWWQRFASIVGVS